MPTIALIERVTFQDDFVPADIADDRGPTETLLRNGTELLR